MTVVARPSSVAAGPTRSDNAIAVASGKGGVGKTFVSIGLSTALARMGRKVLLFDGDLGLANVDVQLGLAPKRDLAGVVAGKITLAQAATRYEPGGFDVVAGRSGGGIMAALPPSRIAALARDLVALSKDYDHVILDLGAGVDRMVRLLACAARTRLVVATADPTSLTDAYAFIKVTRHDDPDAQLRLLINQAKSPQEGERTYQTVAKACDSFLKHTPTLAGIIRHDRRAIEAIRAQAPLGVHLPNADAAVDLQAAAQRLAFSP